MSDVVTITPHPHRKKALAIALVADALQIAILPIFMALFPAVAALDDGIDVIVAIVMIRLLGWHWAFLPSFLAELVPGLGLLPTWTAAVWLVTRKRKIEAPAVPKLP